MKSSSRLFVRFLSVVLALCVFVTPALATTSSGAETEPADLKEGFNLDDPGTNFSISPLDNKQLTVYAGDTSYSEPMLLEANKVYVLWSYWEYESESGTSSTDACFSFNSFETLEANKVNGLWAYISSSNTESQTQTIWCMAATDLSIRVLYSSLRVYSSELEETFPDGVDYGRFPDYCLWGIPIGYSALDGVFEPGQSCYVSFEFTTQAIDLSPESSSPSYPSNTQGPASSASVPPTESPAVSSEPTETRDPTLPNVYNGIADTTGRKMFTEKTRPNYAVFNSVEDNPAYGNETQFLTITDSSTGKKYQRGSLELIPGRQYLVEIYYRNDATFRTSSHGVKYDYYATGALVRVSMPYELAAGDSGVFSAIVSADNTLPLSVSASITLVTRYGLSLEYVDASAAIQRNDSDNIETIDYRKLFRNGFYLGRIGSGQYGVVSFAICAVGDGTAVENLPELTDDNYANLTQDHEGMFHGVHLQTVLVSTLISTVILIATLIICYMFIAPKIAYHEAIQAAAQSEGKSNKSTAPSALIPTADHAETTIGGQEDTENTSAESSAKPDDPDQGISDPDDTKEFPQF